MVIFNFITIVLFIITPILSQTDKDHINSLNEDHNHHHHPNKIVVWFILLAFLLLIWATSLIGACISKNFVKKHNRKIIAISLGTITCTIFYELIPHSLSSAVKLINLEGINKDLEIKILSSFMLLGIATAFLMETAVHFTSKGHIHGHTGCGDDCESVVDENKIILNKRNKGIEKSEEIENNAYIMKRNKPKKEFLKTVKDIPSFVYIDIIAKALHHCIDGFLVGSSFNDNLISGITISVGVSSHEISSSMGSYSIYLSFGLSKRLSVVLCCLSSISHIFSGIISYSLGDYIFKTKLFYYYPYFAIGLFLYLTLSDLLPLLIHEQHGVHSSKNKNTIKSLKKSIYLVLTLTGFFLVGFIPLFALLYFFSHEH